MVAINIVGSGPASETVNGTTVMPEVAENRDIWESLFSDALPMTALIVLVVVAVSLIVGWMFVRRGMTERRKKEQAQARRKAGQGTRPATPPKGAEQKGKDKEKGGRWD